MPRQRPHLILLYFLLLVPFLTQSQQRRRDTLILHFHFDSHQLSPVDRVRLQEPLNSSRIDSISITGYTDKTGTIAYNQRLSQQRADAVYQYVRPGISPATPGQVVGVGVAPTPERSDSDNRRVEIVYYYTLSGGANAGHPNDSIVVVKGTPADSSSTADSSRPTAILALRHINFIVDTPIPTDSTRSILPQFITELQQFKDRRLEIDGFVNSVVPLRGTKDPLFILSVRRAKFIYDYLVNAGFDPNKLSYKGMGNASPINPTPVTREEMNANMRVEIKVY
jgi:outer membrane protein OmpA-like peptidoglycan-associated protein